MLFLFSLNAYLEPAHGEPAAIAAILCRLGLLAVLGVLFATAFYVLSREAALRLIWKRKRGASRGIITASSIIVITFAAAGLYAMLIEPDWVRTARYCCEASSLDGSEKEGTVRLAHLSDLHAEKGSVRRFESARAVIRREKPDLIVLTGDYLNDDETSSKEALGRFISGLAALAPLFAVRGN